MYARSAYIAVHRTEPIRRACAIGPCIAIAWISRYTAPMPTVSFTPALARFLPAPRSTVAPATVLRGAGRKRASAGVKETVGMARV